MRAVRLTRSARKHRIAVEDIRRVLAAPLRTVAQGELELVIGISPARDLIEVVVAPGDPVVVLHAMRLSPVNYRHLAPRDSDGDHLGGRRATA